MSEVMIQDRRAVLRRLAGSAAALALAGLAPGLARRAVAQAAAPRVIAIEARRFRYTPNEIHIRAGEAVTLAFTSIDFVHGFNLPDANVRADLVPGQVTRVEVPATLAPGRHGFLCDNFCGDEHETMSGVLVVDA